MSCAVAIESQQMSQSANKRGVIPTKNFVYYVANRMVGLNPLISAASFRLALAGPGNGVDIGLNPLISAASFRPVDILLDSH